MKEPLMYLLKRVDAELRSVNNKLGFTTIIGVAGAMFLGKAGIVLAAVMLLVYAIGMWPYKKDEDSIIPFTWIAVLDRPFDTNLFEKTEEVISEVRRQIHVVSSITEKRYRFFEVQLMLVILTAIMLVLFMFIGG